MSYYLKVKYAVDPISEYNICRYLVWFVSRQKDESLKVEARMSWFE